MNDDDDLPESSPSADERRGADDRRAAVDRGADPVAELLAAAIRPTDLADDVHERILARALGGAFEETQAPEPEATQPEIRAAEVLRRALEAPPAEREAHELGALASALRAAHDPRPITEIRNEALLRPALRSTGRIGSRALYAAAAGVLALAASMMLYLKPSGDSAPAPSASMKTEQLPEGMVEARSTAPLFTVDDFPQGGGKTSDRADRIAGARSADLRNNRYLAWGVE
ncbi:MAG: hypothetical protein HOV80_20870 [Polyangiaceae bacterium]|nr:hypothetical protein [Polyangiaceae bacterium]